MSTEDEPRGDTHCYRCSHPASDHNLDLACRACGPIDGPCALDHREVVVDDTRPGIAFWTGQRTTVILYDDSPTVATHLNLSAIERAAIAARLHGWADIIAGDTTIEQTLSGEPL